MKNVERSSKEDQKNPKYCFDFNLSKLSGRLSDEDTSGEVSVQRKEIQANAGGEKG